MKYLKKYNESAAPKKSTPESIAAVEEMNDLCIPLQDLGKDIKIRVTPNRYSNKAFEIDITKELDIDNGEINLNSFDTKINNIKKVLEKFNQISKEVDELVEKLVTREYWVDYNCQYDTLKIHFTLDVYLNT